MKTAFLIIFGFCLSSVIIGQTTYYIDYSNGNDDNSGISELLPWKSIDKVNDQVFLPGDMILFKRGEIWEGEQLEIVDYSGTNANRIIFGAYPGNSDPDPVISTIVEHSHNWIYQGENLWKAENPPFVHPQRLWVDGVEILRANNMQELDGINFLWFYNNEENGDFYLFSDVNPSTKEIKYTKEMIPVYLENVHYVSLENLNVQGAWASIYINSDVSNISISDMQIGKFASSGININSENSFSPNNVIISNCSFDADFTLDYSMADYFPGTDDRGCGDGIFIQCAEYCEISDCFFKNWGHASINIDGNPYGEDEVKISNISVHDNYATSPDICYGGRMAIDDAHHCELYNNIIINTSVQCQFNGFENHIHHNIIDGTTNTPILDNEDEIGAGIDVSGYSNTDIYNNIYENNLIKNIEGVGLQISTSGGYNIFDNIFRNNIIYNCGSVMEVEGIGILVQEDTEDCQTYNNNYFNNLVYNENTLNTVRFRNEILDIISFNELDDDSGYQFSDNIAGNPLFVDVSNFDYHLLSQSPCINAGIDALSSFDFEGNPIPYGQTAPDIGIYEYQITTSYKDKYPSNDSFLVYPNPVSDLMYISANNSNLFTHISLFNFDGQLIIDNIIANSIIDLSSLQIGVYFLKLRSKNSMAIRKITLLK